MVYNEGDRRHGRHMLRRKMLCGLSAAAMSASILAFGPGLVGGASAATGGSSTNTTSYCKSGATPITFWGWVPGMYRMVDDFNQTHPNICVDYVTKVGGSGEYIPLLNALKAHSGAPDVAEIEFDVLPSCEVLHYCDGGGKVVELGREGLFVHVHRRRVVVGDVRRDRHKEVGLRKQLKSAYNVYDHNQDDGGPDYRQLDPSDDPAEFRPVNDS